MNDTTTPLEPKPILPTIELAAVFFTEWDRLLTRAEDLQSMDDYRVTVNRDRVNTEQIATLKLIADSLERIGTAIKKAHYGEE